ncbi:MAG: hypothetical protein MI755_08745 [Sphingomonadales bacterium]|nr:hypothetical protein [Sphingomonadales bacterium]
MDWTQKQLAGQSAVSEKTIFSFEDGSRVPRSANLKKIRSAFIAAGVEFIDRNGGGPGVRLRD